MPLKDYTEAFQNVTSTVRFLFGSKVRCSLKNLLNEGKETWDIISPLM